MCRQKAYVSQALGDTGMQVTGNKSQGHLPLTENFCSIPLATASPKSPNSPGCCRRTMGHKRESAPIFPDPVLSPLPTSSPSQSGSCDHTPEAGLTEKPLWRTSCSPRSGFSETAGQRKCKEYFALLKKTDQSGHITEERRD